MIYHGNPTCPTVDNGKDGQVQFYTHAGTQVLYNGIPNCRTVDNDIADRKRDYDCKFGHELGERETERETER